LPLDLDGACLKHGSEDADGQVRTVTRDFRRVVDVAVCDVGVEGDRTFLFDVEELAEGDETLELLFMGGIGFSGWRVAEAVVFSNAGLGGLPWVNNGGKREEGEREDDGKGIEMHLGRNGYETGRVRIMEIERERESIRDDQEEKPTRDKHKLEYRRGTEEKEGAIYMLC
jgi:hypothetical protein